MCKKINWGECDECGSDDISVNTTCKIDQNVYDGDSVICIECGFPCCDSCPKYNKH